MTLGLGVDVTKLTFFVIETGENKLECFQRGFFNVILPDPARVDCFK